MEAYIKISQNAANHLAADGFAANRLPHFGLPPI
jgi:hypothetical protein